MTQSIQLPNEIFLQIMNNSFLIRKGKHPLAKIVESYDYKHILIRKFRGYPKRPFISGPLYPYKNRNRKHTAYKYTFYYTEIYYANRIDKYKLNKIIYEESKKLFNDIVNNFLDMDIDIFFDKYYQKIYYYSRYYDKDDSDYYYRYNQNRYFEAFF